MWQEVNGKNVLAAKVEQGRVVMFSGDEISPFMMFRPTPAWRSAAWLSPLAGASVAILVLTVILWPVAALVRRRYGARFPLEGAEATSHRWTRLAALAVVILLGAWAWQVQRMLSDVSALTSKSEPALWALQLLGLVVFFGAAGVTLWNARLAWTGKRRWTGKIWSTALAVACVSLLYTALVFKLIAFDVNF